jgi:hypothetical protein
MLSPTIGLWFLVGYRPLWGILALHAANFIDVVDVRVLCQVVTFRSFPFEPLTSGEYRQLESRLSTITSNNV